MKFSRIVVIILSVLFSSALAASTVLAQAPVSTQYPPPAPPEEVAPQLVPPYPDYPISEYVYTKTPTFIFSRHPSAIKYKIEVFEYLSGDLLYEYKAVGEVYGDQVWIKPPYPLKIYNITGKVGWYRWRVSAKLGTDWAAPSPQVDFRVATSGFESTFNTDARKWIMVKGPWTVVSPGYLKNPGMNHNFDSIVYKHLITNNFDLTLKMKIKDLNTGHYAGVIVAGDPTSIGPEGEWIWGYYVLYRDDGYAAIFSRDGAGNWETVFPWTFNGIIKPGDWNKIELILGENRTKLYVLFNNSLWTSVTIPAGLRDGYVGITNYDAGVEKEPVWVDWVKTTVFYDV